MGFIKMIEFTVNGDIPSIKNTLRVGKGGVFFHRGDGVRKYKKLFLAQCPVWAKQNLAGKLAVELKIYKKDNRKDGCNLSGTVYDALQFSGVIKNDRSLVERHEFDYIDKGNPRLEVKLWGI
ncbi:MAG: hypothetical protein FD145_907 [Candidatus Saganbacteria bacterium]|uniref:Uncharacterized protein n=1 Tax=Candidatus Saganbacteria bacterium TaxID=2575572 RepID=A0A833NYG2_UNCSA|nr:MAG: hypothetical protein FD145_907 [Candidatus Saganbacteria bacterium]